MTTYTTYIGDSDVIVSTVGTAPDANARPVITSLAVSSVLIGSGGLSLGLIGTGFISTTVAKIDGVAVPTTYVDANNIIATVAASITAVAGVKSVTATSPTPGGGTSAAKTFTVSYLAPALTAITPTHVTEDVTDTTITLTGTGFYQTVSTVKAGVSILASTYVNNTTLTAIIPATLMVDPTIYAITVTNPGPGGGATSSKAFTVYSATNASPVITSLSATSGIVGSADETIIITGTGFVEGVSVPKVNGTTLATYSVDSSTQITCTLTAAIKASAGTKAFTVFNATPGGGTSPASNYTVNYVAPTLATATPGTIIVGSPDTTIFITGTFFYTGVTSAYAGATQLATTITSATTATAIITAAQLATTGNLAITMATPSPGGGTSSSQTISVNNPLAASLSLGVSTRAYFSGAATLAITCTGAIPSSVVNIDGVALATTYNSPTSLTATLPNTAHWPNSTFVHTRQVTITNPSPGGGTSSPVVYTVSIPSYIKCWFRSDKCTTSGSAVTQLTDMSGNGANATASGTARPTFVASDRGSKPAILFDGVANDMRFTLPTANTAVWNWLIDHTVITNTTGTYLIGCTNAPGGGGPSVYQNTQNGLGFACNVPGFANGQNVKMSLGVVSRFYYNNAASLHVINNRFDNGALASGTGAAPGTAYSIGCNMANLPSSYANFKFREIMGASGTIPTADLNEYHAYKDFDDFGYSSNSQIANVVMWGDSITNGVGAAYAANKQFTAACGTRFGLPVNRGVNGSTSNDLNVNFSNTGDQHSLTPVLDNTRPNCVVMLIGINDAILGFVSRATYLANIQSCRTKFRNWCTANLSVGNAALSKFIIVTPLAGQNSAETAPNKATSETLRQGYVADIIADAANWDGVVTLGAPYDQVSTAIAPYYADDRHPSAIGQGDWTYAAGIAVKNAYAAQGA